MLYYYNLFFTNSKRLTILLQVYLINTPKQTEYGIEEFATMSFFMVYTMDSLLTASFMKYYTPSIHLLLNVRAFLPIS
ncbi:MAG: hypothetical protein AMDU4_FER2C00028G0054 [Ferroplasma sp. Type II]|nr:MAG: hypothetical protein AMDU4_FER2C00028G0054 [Ferroplasma sp. Type II]